MTVSINVAGGCREHIVDVRIENYVPATAAKLTGHPDTWEAGEQAEFDVVSAWLNNGKKWRLLGRLLREKIARENFRAILKELDQ